MARQILNPNFSSSQKEESSLFFAHYRKPLRSLSSLCSPCSPRYHKISLARTVHSIHYPCSSQLVFEDINNMTIDISLAMQRWLQDKGLAYYIRVAEAPPHPNSQDMARKLNIDTITNASIRKKLGLFRSGECHFEIPATGALERYFGDYSISAKD